ncbi:DUF692 domain-containing protein [Hydrogenophaga sp.]|uniref:MNIO family bufferin maturase n=1 Tax=Hydrogenophaga sp. TaxID=1904254 RepID=UPI003AF7C594
MELTAQHRKTALGFGALPMRGGLGLKAEHFAHVRDTRPDVGFFEVHAENHLVAGGPMLRHLAAVRADYPLTLHGVGLSIGSEAGLDEEHLKAVTALVQRFEPAVFSEHLAWSSHNSTHFNDLLPLPYNLPTLHRVCRHIDQIQNRIGRPLLLENPSTYLSWAASTWSEGAFMSEVVQRTGCGLLLDVNNVYVSAINQGEDPVAALLELPLRHAGQIHLAGFAESFDSSGVRLLIDNHGASVASAVWALFDTVLARVGPVPTLLERDQNIPAFAVLMAEVGLADSKLARANRSLDAAALIQAMTPEVVR